jgi:DNA-binding CsgD family transcriptional regulator
LLDPELLRIVGRIYDAVIDPDGWHYALDTVRLRHGWHNASMSVIALPASRSVLRIAVNIPDSINDYHDTMASEVLAMWGGQAHLAQVPLEEPLFQTHQTDPETWVKYRFATEWSWPQGIIDQVAILLARDRNTYANVAFAKHESMTIPTGAVDELRVLAPHFRRAATISRLIEAETVRASTFEAALDAAPSGAVLVRSDMGIVHANAAADAMLQSGDPIRSSGGRLKLSEEVVPGNLEAAVLAAAEGASSIGRRGIGIPARRLDGSPLVTHVMPLQSRLATRPAADAVVFLADTAGAEPLPADRLSLLFGLTPAETRVFELAASGESPDQMAQKLGVAPSTVRTHLQRVYEKTGRHRQVELVSLGRELQVLV